MRRNILYILTMCAFIVVFVVAIEAAWATTPQYITQSELDKAFEGAEVVDLATSNVPSVVKLRDGVKLAPPHQKVLVKSFEDGNIPDVLYPIIGDQKIRGVTINGKYVVVKDTEYEKEYNDVLAHELVHAYITLISPRKLPFWIQEGSAVHFSTDKKRKFYGKTVEGKTGVLQGKVAEIPQDYKDKLHNFHYLIEKAGKDRFYEWYRYTIETGDVDATTLLGVGGTSDEVKEEDETGISVWIVVAGIGVIMVVSVIGIYAAKKQMENG